MSIIVMTDDDFEENMQFLASQFNPVLAASFRARDKAQREAMALARAERDRVIALLKKRDTAQQQLAEAVGLLRSVSNDLSPDFDETGSKTKLMDDVDAFLTRHAQAEQQEAKPTAEQLNALDRFHEICTDGEGYDVPVETMHQLAAIGLVDPAPEHGEHGFSMSAKGRAALARNQEAQGAQAGDFQREDRYIVIKRKDLEAIENSAELSDLEAHKAVRLFTEALDDLQQYLSPRQYLVIESDWPEYEPTWAAIQARMTGQGAQAGDEAVLCEKAAREEGLIHEMHGVRSVNSLFDTFRRGWMARATLATQPTEVDSIVSALEVMEGFAGEDWSEMFERFPALAKQFEGYAARKVAEASGPCKLPPEGWECSRSGGHEGPCAARAVRGDDHE